MVELIRSKAIFSTQSTVIQETFLDSVLEISCTVAENGSGADFITVMCKERGDTKCSDRLSCFKIYMFIVVINIPDDVAVGNKVDFTVI